MKNESPETGIQPPRISSYRSSKTGAILTSIYLLGMVTLVIVRWDKFIALGLNELGDFLAGVFGPIAFLWLVLGYVQQGRELRLNSIALNLQAAELANSVEQQKEMATVAKKQLNQLLENHRANINIEIHKFPDRGDFPNIKRAAIVVTNVGYRCTEVILFFSNVSLTNNPPKSGPWEEKIPSLETNSKIEKTYFFPATTDISLESIRISFKDGTGEQVQKQYTLISVGGELQLNEFGAW